ncbi:MAG: hypothetical protein IJT04_04950 [Bacteroidales bacterium]|nr:hypothetical protein [Bacteroidales bacterium]
MMNNKELIYNKISDFVRKYYLNKLLRGAIFFVLITLLTFIVYAVLEYFSYFNTTIRSILFYSYISLFVVTFIFYILIPLGKIAGFGKQLTRKQIAEIIGKHFSEIDDKLLNLFQLEDLINTNDYKSLELLNAAIDAKIEQIKPFPFTQAIPFKNTKRYIKWALIPIFIFIAIFSTKSEVFTSSSERIIYHQQYYQKPAPYQFEVENDTLSTFQNEEFVLHVTAVGESTPDAAYIAIGNKHYQLSKNDNVHFSYTFKNLQSNTSFYIYTDEVTSDEYTLEVLPKPVIVSFTMLLHYPAYLHKPDETIDNNGDATVPDGTRITWSFYTKNTHELSFILPEKTLRETAEKSLYQTTLVARTSFDYAIINKNQFCANKDTLKHHINIITDQYPEIAVESQADSVLPDRIYFKGSIKDDYGFSKARFVYSKYDADRNLLESGKVVPIKINPQLTVQDFFYYFDAVELQLEPGYSVDYYFEVFDNDGVNGAKSSKSSSQSFRVKTQKELDEDLKNSNDQAKKDLQDLVQESNDLLKDIQKLEKQMIQNQELSWQDKKKLEDLLEKYQELKKQIDELQKNQSQQNALEEQYKNMPENLIKKQQELQKRFEDVLSEEMKAMFEKLQKMMNEASQKEDVQKAMKEMKQNTEDLNKSLDQQLELFKQLEFEKKYSDIIEKTKDLSRDERMLSKETEQKAINKNELLQKQENIEQRFNEIKKDLQELKKLNQELADPNKLTNTEDLQKQIEQDMKDSKDALNKNNRNQSAGKQSDAAEKLEKMADQMEMNMLENEEEDLAEDIETIRQILDNLVQISFHQEENMELLRPLTAHSTRLTDVIRTQHNIKENMQLVADSLEALARRQTSVKPFIQTEVSKIDDYLSSTISLLTDRKLKNALSQQQFAMTSMNNLALMLAESQKEMQKKQSECKNCKNKKGGKGSCDKPGGKGKTKSARELQQQLNRQMEALKRSMEQGKQQGKQNPNGQSISEQLAKMAVQQEAIRKMMQECQDALKSENGVGDRTLDKIIKDMEQTEKDLVNRTITTETINRQKNIETRMLESERAEMEREKEDKRESTEAKDIRNPNPPKEWNMDKKTQQQTEMLKSIPANLNYYYKEKVNQYFYNIE